MFRRILTVYLCVALAIGSTLSIAACRPHRADAAVPAVAAAIAAAGADSGAVLATLASLLGIGVIATAGQDDQGVADAIVSAASQCTQGLAMFAQANATMAQRCVDAAVSAVGTGLTTAYASASALAADVQAKCAQWAAAGSVSLDELYANGRDLVIGIRAAINYMQYMHAADSSAYSWMYSAPAITVGTNRVLYIDSVSLMPNYVRPVYAVGYGGSVYQFTSFATQHLWSTSTALGCGILPVAVCGDYAICITSRYGAQPADSRVYCQRLANGSYYFGVYNNSVSDDNPGLARVYIGDDLSSVTTYSSYSSYCSGGSDTRSMTVSGSSLYLDSQVNFTCSPDYASTAHHDRIWNRVTDNPDVINPRLNGQMRDGVDSINLGRDAVLGHDAVIDGDYVVNKGTLRVPWILPDAINSPALDRLTDGLLNTDTVIVRDIGNVSEIPREAEADYADAATGEAVTDATLDDVLEDVSAPDVPSVPTFPVGMSLSQSLNALQDSIFDKFPFCIPSDIFRLSEAFVASPSAPSFTWDFNVLGRHYYFTVDLSQFDSVAHVLRLMLNVFFTLGLIFLSIRLVRMVTDVGKD